MAQERNLCVPGTRVTGAYEGAGTVCILGDALTDSEEAGGYEL